LIIEGKTGYNDSIAHGAPTKSWPVITVHRGQNVTIMVCNTDIQAHGFQIVNYFVRNQETLVPGQVLKLSFVADQPGTFIIYCDIFCSIHLYMQNGLLNVTP
jgi:heme/copper-type cytochrome/quinol oxidase subunit 2